MSNGNGTATVNEAKLQSYRKKILATKIFRHIICVLLCIVSVLPFYLMVINATRYTEDIKTGISFIPSTYFFNNWEVLMEKSNGLGITVWSSMLNSLIVTVPSTLLTIYFSTMTAYGVFAYRFKGRKFAWAFIMAVMMVPGQVTIVGFLKFMQNIGLYDNYLALIIPAIAAPSTVFFMRQYMQGAFSLEIIEAARIDGANEFRIFNTIALPLMRPALATQAIFAFIASWNNLFTPTMLISSTNKSTLPMFVQILRTEQFTTDYGAVYLGLFITVMPIIVVYLILSKYIVAGVALGGVKE